MVEIAPTGAAPVLPRPGDTRGWSQAQKDALQTLKQVRKDQATGNGGALLRGVRVAQAQKTIAEAKKKIDALRKALNAALMMHDARGAARIAKQLGQLAKDIAGAAKDLAHAAVDSADGARAAAALDASDAAGVSGAASTAGAAPIPPKPAETKFSVPPDATGPLRELLKTVRDLFVRIKLAGGTARAAAKAFGRDDPKSVRAAEQAEREIKDSAEDADKTLLDAIRHIARNPPPLVNVTV
jgi:hypothetical protein